MAHALFHFSNNSSIIQKGFNNKISNMDTDYINPNHLAINNPIVSTERVDIDVSTPQESPYIDATNSPYELDKKDVPQEQEVTVYDVIKDVSGPVTNGNSMTGRCEYLSI